MRGQEYALRRLAFLRGFRSPACRRFLFAPLLAIACLALPSAATALTIQTFDFSGIPILGGDNPGFLPDVTAEFSFDGRRIVIFSGGAAKDTSGVLDEVRGVAEGGAFGSIMGRNSFQRPKNEAIELLHAVMDLYAERS